MNAAFTKKFRTNNKYQYHHHFSMSNSARATPMSTVRIHPVWQIKTQGNSNDGYLFSDSQVNFLFQKQATINNMFRKFTNRAPIKMKMLKLKKKSMHKCQLGIGYESKPLDNININTQIKLIHDFYPSKTVSILKKLAFRNTETPTILKQKRQKQNTSQQNSRLTTSSTHIKHRHHRQKTSPSLQTPQPDIQLKITSLDKISQSMYYKATPRQQQLFKSKENKKKRKIVQKNLDVLKWKQIFKKDQIVEQCIKIIDDDDDDDSHNHEVLSPWGSGQQTVRDSEEGGILKNRF